MGILSERRAVAPAGILGGGNGGRGVNLWVRADGSVVNLGGKAALTMQAGDRYGYCFPNGVPSGCHLIGGGACSLCA